MYSNVSLTPNMQLWTWFSTELQEFLIVSYMNLTSDKILLNPFEHFLYELHNEIIVFAFDFEIKNDKSKKQFE